jgi:hypothetical protein
MSYAGSGFLGFFAIIQPLSVLTPNPIPHVIRVKSGCGLHGSAAQAPAAHGIGYTANTDTGHRGHVVDVHGQAHREPLEGLYLVDRQRNGRRW